MSWQGIEGHDAIAERFRAILQAQRLASTYLFVGPKGIGKALFAKKLAQALLCERVPPQRLEPCGECDACRQVVAGTHPDLLQVAKPEERSEIPISLLIGEKDKRMKEGLCFDISRKPMRGGRKVAILDDADDLNEEGANCLLKTLEEPPPRSVLILISTSPQLQYATIRSRCQMVRFLPLSVEQARGLLLQNGWTTDPSDAERAAQVCQGSLALAREFLDPALEQFRQRLLAALALPRFNAVDLAKQLAAFVDEAGKEAPPRRRRTSLLAGVVAEFYRQIMRCISGSDPEGDPVLVRQVKSVVQSGTLDEEVAVQMLERTLDVLEQVNRNANLGTVIEAWILELAKLQASFPVSLRTP